MTRRTVAAAAVLGLLAAPAAQALCLAPTCGCSVSTQSLAFGAHNPIAPGATESAGSVRVQCGGVAGLLIPYQIDVGPGASGSVMSRQLRSGANQLGYGLYRDATLSSIWGDASGGLPVTGSLLLDLLGLAPAQVHALYGRITAGQTTAVPGSYSDSVSITVTYY